MSSLYYNSIHCDFTATFSLQALSRQNKVELLYELLRETRLVEKIDWSKEQQDLIDEYLEPRPQMPGGGST